MGKESKIQWTDNTWNPHIGCHRISAGCARCYMFRDMPRFGKDPNVVQRTKDATFYAPLKWKKPSLVFTCSWSDFFIEEADLWRGDAWEVIRKTPQHTYQILTKRPERIKVCLPDDWGNGYPNVWIGVSVEDQKNTGRIDVLSEIPAIVRFVSAEPLLGEVNLRGRTDKINWVIIGGESGNETGKFRYRPCNLEWIEILVHQCSFEGVAVFVKQFGTHLAKQMRMKDRHGGDIDEFPPQFQVREFPVVEPAKT
ncbi:phage Gp37/Gp68 family protein [bacterium]|nr:phage Gp37/Gp68 family protein [bacterium]